jgi:hypothetical protein
VAKDHDIPVDPDAPAFDLDARTISFTRRKRGRWNADKRRGEEAHCFVCDKPTMVLTPKGDGGVLAHCQAKGCQARGMPMVYAAKADGYDLSAPRSVTRKIADRERAEREVEDAWSALSRRGKAVAASLGVLLDHDASRNFPVELDKIAAATGWSKSSVQRGIDDAVAAGLIKRGRKTFSQGGGKGPINRYALANETVANVIRKNAVQLTIGPDLLGLKLTIGGTQSRRFAGVGESTRISERDMRDERLSLAMRIGEISATVTGIGDEAKTATASVTSNSLDRQHTSHRGGLQGIHPSDHLNQASTAPMSDDCALPVERRLQSAASAHARPRETERYIRARARIHARETPPPPDPPLATDGLEECGYACRDGCVAPLRHKRNAITGALGSGDEQWLRGEKSARRVDTPDNGKGTKWAKSSS